MLAEFRSSPGCCAAISQGQSRASASTSVIVGHPAGATGAPPTRLTSSSTAACASTCRVEVELDVGDSSGRWLYHGEPRSATVVAVGDVHTMTIALTKSSSCSRPSREIALAIMATLDGGRLRDVQAAGDALTGTFVGQYSLTSY